MYADVAYSLESGPVCGGPRRDGPCTHTPQGTQFASSASSLTHASRTITWPHGQDRCSSGSPRRQPQGLSRYRLQNLPPRSRFRAPPGPRPERPSKPQEEPFLRARRGHGVHSACGRRVPRTDHGVDRSRAPRSTQGRHRFLGLSRHRRRPRGRERAYCQGGGVAPRARHQARARSHLDQYLGGDRLLDRGLRHSAVHLHAAPSAVPVEAHRGGRLREGKGRHRLELRRRRPQRAHEKGARRDPEHARSDRPHGLLQGHGARRHPHHGHFQRRLE